MNAEWNVAWLIFPCNIVSSTKMPFVGFQECIITSPLSATVNVAAFLFDVNDMSWIFPPSDKIWWRHLKMEQAFVQNLRNNTVSIRGGNFICHYGLPLRPNYQFKSLTWVLHSPLQVLQLRLTWLLKEWGQTAMNLNHAMLLFYRVLRYIADANRIWRPGPQTALLLAKVLICYKVPAAVWKLKAGFLIWI